MTDPYARGDKCLLSPVRLLVLARTFARSGLAPDGVVLVDGGRALGRNEERLGRPFAAIDEAWMSDLGLARLDGTPTDDDVDLVPRAAAEWAERVAARMYARGVDPGPWAAHPVALRSFLLVWGGRWMGRWEHANRTDLSGLYRTHDPDDGSVLTTVRAMAAADGASPVRGLRLPTVRVDPWLDRSDLEALSRATRDAPPGT